MTNGVRFPVLVACEQSESECSAWEAHFDEGPACLAAPETGRLPAVKTITRSAA